MNWWINHFKAMVAAGHIVPWDDLDRKVVYFVYNHKVREDLDGMIMWHNDHLIRKQSNPTIIRGKPLLMYRFPERFGRRDCKLVPSNMDLLIARDRMAEDVAFDAEFDEALTELARQDNMAYPPATVQDADDMYLALRTEMMAIQD